MEVLPRFYIKIDMLSKWKTIRRIESTISYNKEREEVDLTQVNGRKTIYPENHAFLYPN